MEQKQQPAIMVQSQYIKDMSMEIPHAPAVFKKLRQHNPQVNVEVNVEGNKTYTCSYIASTVLANASGSVDGASLTNYTFSTVIDGVAERRRISRVVLNYTAKRYLGDLIT